MFSANDIVGAFLDGFAPRILIVGIINAVIIGIPVMYIGIKIGENTAYADAIQHKVLEVKYNSSTGDKEFHWSSNVTK